MIQFFNPHATGDEQMVYNGEWPYIHWAEPFSIGVIRYKSIYFVAKTATADVRIDAKRNPFTSGLQDWNFALYNPGHVDSELYAIDWNYFCDLHAVATDHVVLDGQKVKLDGNDVFAYQLIIICRSDVEGEFIETFYINDVPYKIGAEFYGENESLRINLANQGTEIPAIIGKAIYGSDIYEENVDWVLLNQKFRELLVSHLDIMDNKGSYKSLHNALKWFEYDNLVELREVWKYDTPAGTKYYEKSVQTIVTEEVSDRMFNSAKTTYFGLRHLKRHISGHTTEPIYTETTFDYDSDSNGVVKGLACKWTEDEMKLKMVLLGNFFETYFMPVHADLIRSVVEDMSDFTLNMEFGSAETKHDEVVTAETFDFSWGDGNGDDPLTTHEIMLDEIHAYAGLPQSTPYWNAFENDGSDKTRDFAPIIACHTYEQTEPVKGDEVQVMAAMMGQVYNGIGAIEVAHFETPEPIVAGKCLSNQWGECIETSFSGIAKPSNSFNIKFLFPGPGNFDFYFDLEGVSGKHYTRHSTITVVDNLRAELAFYTIRAKHSKEYNATNPFTDKLDITPMMSLERDMKFDVYDETEGAYKIRSMELDPAYTQYIPIRKAHDEDTPLDAPTTTKVRTVQWFGTDAAQASEKVYNKYKDSTSYWVERGTNDEEQTSWIRICSKLRGGYPPAFEPGDYRIFDLDVFFPELHDLVEITPREHVSPYYPIVCVPELHIIGEDVRRVNYTLLSDIPAWEFYSYGRGEVIESFDRNISTPIMARSNRNPMPRGMYKVTFNYRFGNVNRTITASPDWVLENKVMNNA